jgi:Ca-activated chloride channel family protein
MSFSTPWWLLLLVAVVALAVGYLLLLRDAAATRSRSRTWSCSTGSPDRPGRLRHLPALALILVPPMLTVALAGPTAEARVPRNRATVVLVIDVSLSMQAKDVEPTRLAAAQAAAKSFADQLTPGVNLGLVAFAGTAAVLVSPTTDRASVKRAVDSLQLSESTATGEAIFAAMSSVETFSQSVSGTQDGPPPARIVLMSDGKQTVPGPDGENEPRGAFTAARKAAEAKVPVSTISFGTDYGSIEIDGDRTSVAVDDASMRRSPSCRAGSSSPPRARGAPAGLRRAGRADRLRDAAWMRAARG